MNRRNFITALGAVATGKLRRLRDEDGDFGLPDPGLGTATPTITTTRYPYIQNVRNDRISVLWATLESGAGIVECSSDGINFNRVAAQSRIFTAANTGMAKDFVQYQANITGLQPATDYVYRVSVNGLEVTPGGATRFRTAGPGPFNFIVLGDSGYASAEQYAIAQRILAESPSLVIHTGDVVYNPGGAPGTNIDLYQRNYFNYYYQTMSSVPFFPSPGNHDYGPTAAPYLAIHALPTENVPFADRHKYYSFDWGNVHFVSLDGHESLERDYHDPRAEVRGTQIVFHAIRYDGVELDSYSVAPRPMFSDDPTIQPFVMTPGPIAGATVRILGRALAGEEAFACTPVPPTDLGGTSVTVNGNPIQLLYVSASQIYAQLPFNVDGNVTVRVTTANGSSEMSF